MSRRATILLGIPGCLLGASPQRGYCQDSGSISEVITSAAFGRALPGVDVYLEKTGQGTATGQDGRFEMLRVRSGLCSSRA